MEPNQTILSSFHQSPTVANLIEALSKAQSQFQDIKKNCTARIPLKEGRQLVYSYADLAEILRMIRPVLAKQSLAIAQPIHRHGDSTSIRTILAHASGEFMSSEMTIHQDRDGIQGFGSAITYLRRYCLTSMLAIAAEDEDDGAAAQNNLATKPVQREPSSQQSKGSVRTDVKSYTVTEPQVKRLMAIAGANQWSDNDIKSFIKTKFNLDSKNKLNKQQYDFICDYVQKTHPVDMNKDEPPPHTDDEVPF